MYIKKEWLEERGSVAYFEAQRIENTARLFNIPLVKLQERWKGKPFGNIQGSWERFVNKMHKGDELWTYSSPICDKMGTAGFAIVRAGEVVEVWETVTCEPMRRDAAGTDCRKMR